MYTNSVLRGQEMERGSSGVANRARHRSLRSLLSLQLSWTCLLILMITFHQFMLHFFSPVQVVFPRLYMVYFVHKSCFAALCSDARLSFDPPLPSEHGTLPLSAKHTGGWFHLRVKLTFCFCFMYEYATCYAVCCLCVYFECLKLATRSQS